MDETADRKRLFSPTRRRRPPAGAAPKRLLGGQAMAQAQRLSRETIKPAVLGWAQLLLDAAIIVASAMMAFAWIDGSVLGLSQRVQIALLGALLFGVGVGLSGGYGLRRMRVPWLTIAIAVAVLTVMSAAMWALLAWAGLPGAFVTQEVWALLALGAIIVQRLVLHAVMARMMQDGRLEHRIVLVGGGEAVEALIGEIDRNRRRGRHMCGFFDERRNSTRSPSVIGGHHKMGDVDDLVEFARWAKIDTVVVAIPQASQARIRELLSRLFVLPVDIRVLDGAEIPGFSRARRSRIGPFRLIEIYKRPMGGRKAFEKRVFDLVFASLAIVMLAPVMLVVAALIRLESPGPVLFRQRRHGYNNKPIKVLKFRSMYADQCDPTAVRQVRRGDARVTRVGRFIRRASIDELPQFFNVLRGDLSLVGPRPHAMSARTGDILYDEITEAYSARHKVKPGVTGWAQINGWRGEMNSPEKIRKRVEFDLYYIEHWSLWLDFKIMMLTPWSLVTTKNAY